MRPPTSQTARRFTESVIREMTRVCAREGGINLAQGFPDFAAPEAMKAAAKRAIDADINQYAITWGTPRLRAALAEKYGRFYAMEVDTEREIVVTCGATEAMASAMLALVDALERVDSKRRDRVQNELILLADRNLGEDVEDWREWAYRMP